MEPETSARMPIRVDPVSHLGKKSACKIIYHEQNIIMALILHKIQRKCNTSRLQNSMDKINVKTVMIISNRDFQ